MHAATDIDTSKLLNVPVIATNVYDKDTGKNVKKIAVNVFKGKVARAAKIKASK